MKRLVVLLALVACGGKAVVEKPEAEAVDADEAVEEARSLIEEAYASLRRGDANGLMPLLAPDVFLVGPRGDQVLPAGSDALVGITDWLDAQDVKKHKLKSRDLQVVASSGGHAAWATDQIELDGATYAMTAVLTHADDLWHFRAVHVSQTWKAKQLDKQERVAGGTYEAGKPEPELLELAEEAFVDLEARLEQLPDEEDDAGFDAVVISTAPKGATHSAKKIAKAWNKLLGKEDEGKKKKKKKKKQKPPPPLPETELIGDPGFGATDDGALAWFCGNVTTDGVPHRVFLLYAKVADEWRLLALHDAAIVK